MFAKFAYNIYINLKLNYIMKKILIIFIFTPFISFSQNVFIPDVNFKSFLLNDSTINTNKDTAIQVTEANNFSGPLICRNLNIIDLTGIEHFTSLTHLDCDTNQITKLDISKNLALTILRCGDNNLTNLDLSKNIALFFLHCPDNQLDSLNVKNNISLKYLACYMNKLTSLDVSTNTDLASLLCGANQLTSLDVSTNKVLSALDCANNQLSSLDLRNGNNINMWWAQTAINPHLSCINVDNEKWSTINWKAIDKQHFFSNKCSK